MGLTSTFSIALRGLHLAQSAMEVVSHNIANVNTEGYSRQRINLEATYPIMYRYGPMGTGVDAVSITRFQDQFLTKNLIDKNSVLAKYEAQKGLVDSLEGIFNESTGNGINSALSEFWSAWQEVTNNPEGNPQRYNLLEKAATLADQIRLARQDMDALRMDINRRVEEAMNDVNTLTKEIATINEKIVSQEVGGTNRANDLRDKREEHLKQLAALVDIDYWEDPANGTVSVATPKGTPLVSTFQTWSLGGTQDENGDLHVEWQRPNGGVVDLTDTIYGGKLGGMLELRDQIMRDMYRQFDAFSEGMIKEVNRQHCQGVGLSKYTDLTSNYDLSDYPAVTAELPGEDNDIKLSAVSRFAGTNQIGIKFVKAAAPGTDITINTSLDSTTNTYNITVTLPINNNGNVIVTTEEVVRAINEDVSPNLAEPPPFPPVVPFKARDILRAEVAHLQKGKGMAAALNDSTDIMNNGLDFIRLNTQLKNVLPFGDQISYAYSNAQLETKIDGDNNDLVFRAVTQGAAGENISVEYVETAADNPNLQIQVNGNDIRVILKKENGVVTSTAEDVLDAINNSPLTKNLVTVNRVSGQSGAGLVAAMPKQYLSRSGSFNLVVYDPDGRPTVNKIFVNPTDTREDVLNQIGSKFSNGAIGVAAEIMEDTGKHYLRIKADTGYSFAFGQDSASALMVLGLNTFFSGYSNATIGINSNIANDARLIASGQLDAQGLPRTGDSTNALTIANIKDKQFDFLDQHSTISEAYNTLGADVGATTHAVTRSHDFNQSLVDNINGQRDMIAAVNMDEEMADLMKYQYMYQASAKMISTADELLQTLLAVK